MPKPLVVELEGERSTFHLRRLRRETLYGSCERLVLDPASLPCERAELTRDGSLLLRSGMIATGYFDNDGRQISRSELVGLGPDGAPVPRRGSTLGAAQALTEAPPTELLDLAATAAYRLSPDAVAPALTAALLQGRIFRCDFNYRSGYHLQSAFLVANEDGVFLIVGDAAEPPWSGIDAPSAEEDAPVSADEIDFRMF